MSERAQSGPATGAAPGLLGKIGAVALLVNVVGLFEFTGVALVVFGYLALTMGLLAWTGPWESRPGSAEVADLFLMLSWLAALVGGAGVGAFRWFEFDPAAYAVLALFALALLVRLLGRTMRAWNAAVHALCGALMLLAVRDLEPPPGADDMEEAESWTYVDVQVVDQAGRPIEWAKVHADLLWPWEGEPAPEDDREWWQDGQTLEGGKYQFAIMEDVRFKRFLLRVERGPDELGRQGTNTVGGHVGYEPARLETALPAGKVPYAFRVDLPDRPHPDVAFLEVVLEPGDARSREIHVVLDTERDFPWFENGRTFNDYRFLQTGGLRSRRVEGTEERILFPLGEALGGRPLLLRALERFDEVASERYAELLTRDVEPVPYGAEATIRVALPR